MEKQSVSRLIGAPPGYVGYEDGGKLTEEVRRRPYCLVLFDELEKAHHDVSGILLQIMEEGVLTDSTGRRVSFQNAVVVMTSNIGGELRSDGLGFSPSGRADQTMEQLRKAFSPEFLGRLDRIVCFKQLTQRDLQAVADKYLCQLTDRLSRKNIRLVLPEGLGSYIASLCKPADGARHIRRIVQQQVEGPLVDHMLDRGEIHGTLNGFLDNGSVYFSAGKGLFATGSNREKSE